MSNPREICSECGKYKENKDPNIEEVMIHKHITFRGVPGFLILSVLVYIFGQGLIKTGEMVVSFIK